MPYDPAIPLLGIHTEKTRRERGREIEKFMVKKLVTFLVLSQLQTLTSFSAVNTDIPAVNTESSEEGRTACIGEKRKNYLNKILE